MEGGGGSLKNNPKNLCLFCIAALDFEVFWKGKPHLTAELLRTGLDIWVILQAVLLPKKYSNLQEPQ